MGAAPPTGVLGHPCVRRWLVPNYRERPRLYTTHRAFVAFWGHSRTAIDAR